MISNSSFAVQKQPPKSSNSNVRGSLSGLFNSLQITSLRKGSKSRHPKPLPPTPGPPLAPRPSQAKLDIDIKRICIPDHESRIRFRNSPIISPGWTQVNSTDTFGRKEVCFVNDDKQKLRGCCVNSKEIIGYIILIIDVVLYATTKIGYFTVPSMTQRFRYFTLKWMVVFHLLSCC